MAAAVGAALVGGALAIGRDQPTRTPVVAAPVERVATAPVPLSRGEQYIRARVLADGQVSVDEWLHAARPLHSARLSATPADGSAVRAQHVLMQADGRTVTPTATHRYRLRDARRLHLSYRLTGAVINSSDGRAVVRTSGLQLDVAHPAESSMVTVTGATVLTLACRQADQPQAAPCGQRDDSGWFARLDGDQLDDVVFAAVQLPG